MKRRQFVCATLGIAAAAAVHPVFAATDEMVVHKDPNCRCCRLWADAMAKAGYRIRIVEESDLNAVKVRLGVPLDIQGCHTAEYRGQFLEGHVPLDALPMLALRTDLVGLAVPGMPAGSLGMGDDPLASYDVIGVARDGNTSVFVEVRPKV